MAGYHRFVHKPFVSIALLAGVGLTLSAGCGVPRSPVAQPPARESTPRLYDLAFVELSDRIHVAYRPDVTRTPVHGNVTLLFNEQDVVVVDAGNSPVSARQIIEHVRSVTGNPVSFVINTHGHEDHTLGNQEFLDAYPGAEIVARQGTREYLTSERIRRRVRELPANLSTRRAPVEAEIARLMERASPGDERIVAYLRRYHDEDLETMAREYRRVRLTAPTVVFETRLVLSRAGRTIELLDLGPGKSGSATVVYLPDEKVVIAGDVVTHPIPYGFARDPAGWLATLKRLAELDFMTLIPGHGDVLFDRSYLRRLIELVEFTLSEATKAVDDGLGAQATRARIDYSVWQQRFTRGDPILDYRFETWFIEPVVARAHRALSGAEAP